VLVTFFMYYQYEQKLNGKCEFPYISLKMDFRSKNKKQKHIHLYFIAAQYLLWKI